MARKIKTEVIKEVLLLEENPSHTLNPRTTDVLAINKKTGESFICIDSTKDKNLWLGNSGTAVSPPEVFVVDIFNDGSIIEFFRFEGDYRGDVGFFMNDFSRRGIITYWKGRFGLGIDLSRGYVRAERMAQDRMRIFFEVVPWTFSAWVNLNSFEENMGIFTADRYLEIGVKAGSGELFVMNLGEEVVFDRPLYFPKNEYAHVVVTKTSSHEIRAWINLEGAESISTNSISVSNNQYGFGITSRGYSYLQGVLDHVRIFARPISESEAKILYNEKPIN